MIIITTNRVVQYHFHERHHCIRQSVNCCCCCFNLLTSLKNGQNMSSSMTQNYHRVNCFLNVAMFFLLYFVAKNKE